MQTALAYIQTRLGTNYLGLLDQPVDSEARQELLRAIDQEWDGIARDMGLNR